MSPELQAAYLLKVALAVLFGGVIGWERQMAHKVAGFRTHMFIAGSSAIFVLLSIQFTQYFHDSLAMEAPRADPVRVIHAIIVGISFVGAGMIIQNEKGDRVKGLTTASSVLFTASVGIAVALGAHVFAIGVTAMALLINHTLKDLENRLLHPPDPGCPPPGAP